MKMTVSASSEPSKTSPLLVAWMFIVLGVTITAWMSWSVVNVIRARNWIETPCVILDSSVEQHTGSKGSTYSVSVSYEYQIDGQKFTGDRYKFMRGSDSERQSKIKIVANLPRGLRTVCYVNPADRQESVLERRLTADMGFTAIPLIFALIGVALLLNRRERKKRRLPTPVLGGCLAILIGALVLGIFLGVEGIRPVKISGSIWVWWLIVSGMIFFILIGGWAIIHYFRRTKPPLTVSGSLVLREPIMNQYVFLLSGVFMLIFNFISYEFGIKNGIKLDMWPLFAFALFIDYIFLFILFSRFTPKPILTLRDGDLRAGRRLDLEWDFERSDRVKQLSFTLQGVYQDYDQKYPDTFANHPLLLNLTDPKQIRHGTLTFNLPADLRPTSRDADGQVAWKIVAEITTGARLLSTTKREYPVTISA